jgi:uncharacterized protein (UPF0276 family)
LGDHINGYEYETGYKVDNHGGSTHIKKWKLIIFHVQMKRYLEDIDWMEVHYENFNDKYYIQHVFLGQGYSQ